MGTINLFTGDSLEVLKQLPENSIDSIVCDPPYGLSFMAKKWDYDVPSKELWEQALRVLKPGGHLLAFGGTRTYHRLVVNIEDAGFEIRDQIQWLYGSGFPKSTDVSKRIDKEAGATREILGVSGKSGSVRNAMAGDFKGGEYFESAASTDQAKQWQGWGTALKPANEPICVARKPLEKGLTVAQNVLKYGTGAINIDESRISVSQDDPNHRKPSVDWQNADNPDVTNFGSGGRPIENLNTQGRWPANIILDEVAAQALDEQSGNIKSAGNYKNPEQAKEGGNGMFAGGQVQNKYAGQIGGASRFFYVAKASKRERGEGNVHPTIKPIKLMEYLIRLVTPKGGTTLDPFMGSGSTGVAAKNLGFNFVGIELNPEYTAIAEKRIGAENELK